MDPRAGQPSPTKSKKIAALARRRALPRAGDVFKGTRHLAKEKRVGHPDGHRYSPVLVDLLDRGSIVEEGSVANLASAQANSVSFFSAAAFLKSYRMLYRNTVRQGVGKTGPYT